MYSHTFFVTSVRGMVDLPQMALNSLLSFLGAKMPFPAFFWASAFFLPVAFLSSAFVIVVFFVVVV